MRNRETRAFAQHYSGRFWARAGGYAGVDAGAAWTGRRHGGAVQHHFDRLAVPLLAAIPATEQALKREFDDFGRKR